MGSLVAATRTPISMSDAVVLLSQAFLEKGIVLGKAAPYLIALLALENRNGEAIYNYNWGNVIRFRGSDDYFKLGANPREFRSLKSHREGANYYVSTLLSPTNKRIVRAALNDDFEGFFRGIHDINPDTKKAYNLLTDDAERSALAKTYATLIREYSGDSDAIRSAVSNRKPARRVKRDKSSGLAFFMLVAAIGGAFVLRKKVGLTW
jgi:hypothetical protein